MATPRGAWRKRAPTASRSSAATAICPAQFLNPRVNRRDDQYRRLAREPACASSREAVAAVAPAGAARTSSSACGSPATRYDVDGLTEETRRSPPAALLKDDLDYFNVIAGTSASHGGAVHIVPPMADRECLCGALAAAAEAGDRQAGLRRGPHQPAAGGRAGARRRARPICAA